MAKHIVTSIWIDGDELLARTAEGRTAHYNLKAFPSLATASQQQREQFTVSRCAIHWPALNEDINLEGMLYDNGLCTLTANEDSVEYHPELEHDMVAEP